MLRISARASLTTSPQNTTVKTSGGAVHPVYAAHVSQPTGQDMLNTIADQVHSTDENVLPVHDTEHHGFVIHRASRGDRFPSQPDESGASGESATSDRWWSCRPDTPRIFCHPAPTLRTASRTAASTAPFRLRSAILRHTGKTPAFRCYRQRLPLTAGQYQFRPGSGQFLKWRRPSGGSTPP